MTIASYLLNFRVQYLLVPPFRHLSHRRSSSWPDRSGDVGVGVGGGGGGGGGDGSGGGGDGGGGKRR